MNKFLSFFISDDDFEEEEDEVVEESVVIQEPKLDPVLEQIRKEKFSTPLIYDDEEDEPEANIKTVKKPEPIKKTAPVSQPKEEEYRMIDIISPMAGLQQKYTPTPKPAKRTTPKKKVHDDNRLVQVLSPFYGMGEEKEETVETPKTKKSTRTIKRKARTTDLLFKEEKKVEEKVQPIIKKEEKPVVKPEVKENDDVKQQLRSLSNILDEESENLKIIEERTGEFKLDFKETNDDFIASIDDTMGFQDLMNLYEKKFKD